MERPHHELLTRGQLLSLDRPGPGTYAPAKVLVVRAAMRKPRCRSSRVPAQTAAAREAENCGQSCLPLAVRLPCMCPVRTSSRREATASLR